MAGQIKRLIDEIVEQRAKGNPLLVETTRAKLIFKGLNPARFHGGSPDDPKIIAKVRAIAVDLGVELEFEEE